jgi:ribonuclease T1
MQKNYTQLLLGLLIGLLVGLVLGRFVFSPKQAVLQNSNGTVNTNDLPQQSSHNNNGSSAYPKAKNNKANNNVSTNNEGTQVEQNIPAKVYDVLQYVKTNAKAMDGYVGGRVFQNRENQLPMTDDSGNKIDYQEWDVNPKVEGKNRGTQRMVTGSDGRSWYTSDHYKSFTLIKQ